MINWSRPPSDTKTPVCYTMNTVVLDGGINWLFHISVLYMYGSLFWQLIIRPMAIYLTPWSTALHAQPAVSQPVNKFPVFYRKWKFITVFTTACHLSLKSARSIASWLLMIHCNMFSHLDLCLPHGLFCSGFPTKTLYTHCIFSIHAECLSISCFLNWSLKSFDKFGIHKVMHRNIFLT